MMRISLLTILLSAATIVFAQQELPYDPDNYYEYISYWDDYFDDNGSEAVTDDGMTYKQYHRFKTFMGQRCGSDGSMSDYSDAMNGYYGNISSLASVSGTKWCFLGPNRKPQLLKGGYEGQEGKGRLNATWVDPNDLDNIYVGASHGGLWHTTDAGDHWENLSDNIGEWVGGVESIEVSHANSDHIFIACRTEIYEYYAGVFKSTNGGQTWTKVLGHNISYTNTSGNTTWWPIDDGNHEPRKIIMDPDDADVLYLATRTKVFKSTDAGDTWTQVLGLSYWLNEGFWDIDIEESDPDHVIVSGQEVYESFDGFNSYTSITASVIDPSHNSGGNTFQQGRIEISKDYSSNETLYHAYLWLEGSNKRIACVEVERVNNTMTTRFAQGNQPGAFGVKFSFQVSPNDESTCYVGGWRNWQWHEDQGTGGLRNISNRYPNTAYWVHDDTKGELVIQDNQGSDAIFAGTDGGLFVNYQWDPSENYTDNLSNKVWHDLSDAGVFNDGLDITEFHGAAASEGKKDVVLGGAQDVGCISIINGAAYSVEAYGDGGAAVINHSDVNRAYSYFGGGPAQQIRHTQNGWLTNAVSTPSGFGDAGLKQPFEIHPTDADKLYLGWGQYLLLATGALSSSLTFTDVTPSNLIQGKMITAFAIAASDPDVMYVAAGGNYGSSSQTGLLLRSGNGGASWVDISGGNLGFQYGECTDIEIDPADEDHIWLTFGNTSSGGEGHKVYVSLNGGSTWASFCGTIQGYATRLPANSIKYDDEHNDLYMGTDGGVYYRDLDGINGWELYNGSGGCNMPFSVVQNVMLNKHKRKVRASTFGRGIWESYFPNCYSQDNITITSHSQNQYMANNQITSTATASTSSNIDYESGYNITLEPGFVASQGTDFRAFIHPTSCYCTCSSSGGNKRGVQRLGEESNEVDAEEADAFHLTISPNPNHGVFEVSGMTELPAEVNVFDQSGKRVHHSVQSTGDRFRLDLSAEPSGVYIIQAIQQGRTYHGNLIKQ